MSRALHHVDPACDMVEKVLCSLAGLSHLSHICPRHPSHIHIPIDIVDPWRAVSVRASVAGALARDAAAGPPGVRRRVAGMVVVMVVVRILRSAMVVAYGARRVVIVLAPIQAAVALGCGYEAHVWVGELGAFLFCF